MEGPAEPGAIDIPDGLTPQQVIEGEKARQEAMRHLGRRRVLTMDELAELKDARPRVEKEFKLPGDSRGRSRVYMFSIDGTLRGTRLNGCLFAGECIVVQETSFERAHNLAKEGLQSTIDLAYEFWKEDQGRLAHADPMGALKIDVGGGRAGADLDKRVPLERDPKMRAFLEHMIGKKPWKY